MAEGAGREAEEEKVNITAEREILKFEFEHKIATKSALSLGSLSCPACRAFRSLSEKPGFPLSRE
jgi:hypothetical protein